MTATNVILTKESVVVTVYVYDIEENYTKVLSIITPPKTSSNQSLSSGANPSKILDILNKAEERYTINGYLTSGNSPPDTHSIASVKKNDLKQMFFAGGVIAMSYAGESLNINMDKLSVKLVNKEGMNLGDQVAEYDVMFTAIKGENL